MGPLGDRHRSQIICRARSRLIRTLTGVLQLRLASLLALFFFSGACGLIYQVLWLRLLSLTFGVTVYAASTVLAAFMAGLALGSMLAGPLLTRVRRPLLIFGVAEMLIGVAALATPLELDAASRSLPRAVSALPRVACRAHPARLVCGFVVLLPPTMLMGLTLPVLSASALVRGSRLGLAHQRALCDEHRGRGHRRGARRVFTSSAGSASTIVSARRAVNVAVGVLAACSRATWTNA